MERRHDRDFLDSQALREIVEGTAAETGEGFFDALVKHLAGALGTKCAWVTEWLADERRLRAISFWAGDDYVEGFEYAIADTPCAPVIENRRLFVVPDCVVQLYPQDALLEPLGAVSYMGVPLFDMDGQTMGHLAILDDAPLVENESVSAIFNIFAGRAAAELRRLRRDRSLRERERQLSALFDGAMDAIVELDAELRVANLNAAARRVFGANASSDPAIDHLFTDESRGKLAYLAGELQRQPDGQQSLWIPDGIAGIGPGGEEFPAEATLSRYSVAGRAFYSLILRNVRDRVAAEQRIHTLVGETAYLRAEIEALRGFEDIVGDSASLRGVLADVEKIASTDTTVLITGETGTGKELVARAIHRRSERADRPMIAVNCAAISANLQESEFFGHEKGAFTGALQRREGRFQLADGGTIFLDELGEMSLDLQAKLLRVLQEGEFEPVGSSRTVRVDVRVVAATNRDLEQLVKDGSFRADLMYRLNVFPIHLPPLRERGDDVVLLGEMFARNLAKRQGRTVAPLTERCKSRLRGYEWPGNIRELQNVIERAFITSLDGRSLNLDRALPAMSQPAPAVGSPAEDAARILTAAELKDLERASIERALTAADGRVSGSGGAAELLGINPNTLASRMKSLGIAKRMYRGS